MRGSLLPVILPRASSTQPSEAMAPSPRRLEPRSSMPLVLPSRPTATSSRLGVSSPTNFTESSTPASSWSGTWVSTCRAEENETSGCSPRPEAYFSGKAALLRHPVDFFLDGSLVGETTALEDGFAVLDHFRMAAKIGDGVGGVDAPLVGVFPQNVIGTADFAGPL